MLLVETPAFQPGACLITGTNIGPFIDTEIELDDLPGYGRVYLAVSTVENLGQFVGLQTKDEADRLRAEVADLRARLTTHVEAIEKYRQLVAALVAADYREDDSMSVRCPTPTDIEQQASIRATVEAETAAAAAEAAEPAEGSEASEGSEPADTIVELEA